MTAVLVGAGLILTSFVLAWVGSWDRGPNPRETFDLQDRKRRAEAMRVAEGGLCCCHEHGPRHCRVHAEGEALDPYHVCGHCASPPWSDTWVHEECTATCCGGGL